MGFLWYIRASRRNIYGDVGSLSLGGTLGTDRRQSSSQEILLFLVGGIFVIEALSVICRSVRS